MPPSIEFTIKFAVGHLFKDTVWKKGTYRFKCNLGLPSAIQLLTVSYPTDVVDNCF